MGCVRYLTLQATREGQAAHAHVHEIVKGLKKLGWEVQLYEPHYANDAPRMFSRLRTFFSLNIRLATKIRRGDILYIRAHIAAWPISLWAYMRGGKVVQEVNGPYQDVFAIYPGLLRMRRIAVAMMRAPLRWANAVVVVTPELGEWVKREASQKHVVLIPNAANVSLFNPHASSGRPLPPRYVSFFGALSPWQGIEDLLAAVHHEEWPADVKLVILGGGVQEDKVREAARRNARVVYLGRVPYHEVPGIVAKSIASVIPKNNDIDHKTTGLSPLKLYESMACGVPCIVTEIPGLADTVRASSCGIVIPPSDASAIARAVAQCAGNADLAKLMGKNAREIAVLEHSWEARARDTAAVLAKLDAVVERT